MPLPQAPPKSYVAVRRLYVDSEQRSSGTVSDYVFTLPSTVVNVVAMELTAFSIPSSMTPTFRVGVNDAIDFVLTNGSATTMFSAFMPSFSYTYQNVAVPYLDFLRGVEQVLNLAIAFDADFGVESAAPVVFSATPDPEERLRISATNATFALRFRSGPNAARSAFRPLGFQKVDYAATSDIVADFRSLLEPFRRIEISVAEVYPRPLAVVYNTNASYYGQVQNEFSSRLRLIDNAPPRKLTQLSISVRIDGEPVEDAAKNEHSLCFSLFYFVHVDQVPRWLTQFNTL
jgi:hypothetical protein